MSRYGIFDKEDKNGYLNFYIATTLSEKSITPLRTFSDKNSAIGYMERLVKRHILCQKLCGTYVTEGPCFHHQIKKCNGACVGTESSESYNKRAMEALSDMQMKHESFFISDGFPSNGNTPFVLIENGSYKGYGLLPIDSVVSGIEDCYTYLEKSYFDDKDANAIIQSFMKHKRFRLVRFQEIESNL
ncbi:MAG: hypothetical protein CVU11_15980 [Bacteroidetes bacterium HGW-Bacteroidetes-6]|nr:MAG: hypothetical protein CVU11_15980 [Bacteroidetes bacterium HGW-Bacteroidetes-6]